ncbi:MAG: mechanosensitive ion channel family protein [Pseudomonadota bacterium]
MHAVISLAFLVLSLGMPPAGPAHAQSPAHLAGAATTGGDDGAAPALPTTLTPAVVDALMSELSDEQVRQILRDELQRQAAEQAAAEDNKMDSYEEVVARLDGMFITIGERTARWWVALGNLSERQATVEERLARGSLGPWGIFGALALLVAAGLIPAFFARWLLRTVRQLVAGHPPPSGQLGYWEGVVRTVLLTVVDLLPVAAFSLGTTLAGRLLSGPLGPLTDYVWILQAGISEGWGFVVLLNRAFSPDYPHLRIGSVDDAAAEAIVRVGQRVVSVAIAGWLLAGLSPTLGFGFPPAMVIVAGTGIIVTIILTVLILKNRHPISNAVTRILPRPSADHPTPWQHHLAQAAPFLGLFYVLIAAVYWLLNWLETGQLYLTGPSSTILVLLVLPLFDRLGEEMARALTARATARGLRFRAALFRLWRLFLGILAVGVITRLWGFNFFDLAHGPNAPDWAAPVLNVVWAFVIAWAAWQLIRASLWHERRASTGAEEDDQVTPGGASRLDTLLPLFRIALGLVIAVTLLMYGLSEAGLNIGPLLASAGIVGIAVGFGAQTLVRDIFSGIFFLIDDAFRVGEYIELEGDLRGEVENISIRSLQLRHHRGPVVTIPFGELKSVTNHNRDWVIYKMNFRMEPDTDPKKFKKLVKQVGAEFLESPEHGHKFLEPLKSQGVYMVDDDSALVFRVKFKCKPRQQFVLRREIYHRLREVFAANDLNLSRRKVEVVQTGDGDGPVGLPDELLQQKPAAPAAE